MLVSRRPAATRRSPTLRSVSPSMLFTWMPVPGTITPDPQPVDADSEAAFPLASITEMCVVDGMPAGSRAGGRVLPWARLAAAATSASSNSRPAKPPR
jgi:hypothetical protein